MSILYLVKRIDDVKYDEYSAFVVRAKNREEALELCKDYEKVFNTTNTEITELNMRGTSGVILDSFRAG